MDKYRRNPPRDSRNEILSDCLKTAAVLILTTAVCLIFRYLGFSEANIITVYILGVLIIAVTTGRRVYSLVGSVISVLSFNYLFTWPYFSLNAYDDGYPVTFLVMFISAFITSSLTTQIKSRGREAAEAAYRTRVLLKTNQMIQKQKDRNAIAMVVIRQISKLLGRSVLVYLISASGELDRPMSFTKNGRALPQEFFSDYEKNAVRWTLENNQYCGTGTKVFGRSRCLYLAVRVEQKVYGVVGIAMDEKKPLDSFESDMVYAILGECGLALQNEESVREREEIRILARNEQLRANLLRSISHDLRTPLTSISGNASILMSNADKMSEEHRHQLYVNIYDDAIWLVDLVENLLAITRIDGGAMSLNFGVELLDEIIAEAMKHLDRKRSEHHIAVHQQDEFVLVRADARLMVQVMTNIINNAIKYTPAGSHIDITLFTLNNEAVVDIADDGDGIPDEAKEKIFEMFYTLNNEIADSRRSMGLGLALCKSIVTAHSGKITVFDNHPKGTVFRIVLPIEEVTLRE